MELFRLHANLMASFISNLNSIVAQVILNENQRAN